MTSLSTLRAVDGVTASLCAEIRSFAKPHDQHGALIFLKDIPAQYRFALARQGVRELITIGDEAALKLESVEAWLRQTQLTFHAADACESIPGITVFRRFALGGIADGKIGKREAQFAQEQGRKAGLGPIMTLVAERLSLPLLPESDGVKVLPPPESQRVKALPGKLVDKLLTDQTVQTHEVWQLVERARNDDPESRGLGALTQFRKQHDAAFTPDARSALDDYLRSGALVVSTEATAHASLRRLWQETRREWDLSVIAPPAREHTKEEMLVKAKSIFTATNDDGYRLASEVKRFFEKYPSTGGRSLSTFFSGWAINETFGSQPLQAFNYTMAHPVDDAGNPRGPLWRAYVQAVRSNAPRDIIEESFLRAHIADYKRAVLSPDFRKLYEISLASYRKGVDAYVHTLRACEAELDFGAKPTNVAKLYPLAVTRELVRRGTIGMVWNRASFRNGLNPRNPLTQEWWFGFWGMLGTFFSNQHPKAAKADAITVDLTQSERDEIKAALGIDMQPGLVTVDAKALASATFAEPRRGVDDGRPLPRYPLAFSDFARVDPLHAPLSVAGADGVFQAKELLGVVRQAQSRVRSNLIDAFHAKYPTPMNGLLVYSANMLALTNSYHQHEAYGMVPNFIMPVDNFGRPKTPKWQAYVDAHKEAAIDGSPSKEVIERLWFEAHMEDFEQIDSPEFRKQAELFWRDAIRDPALAPLATYFIAMVHGRDVFDQARADRLPYEEALVRSFDHFRETLIGSGNIPFLGEEVRNVARLFTDSTYRDGPAFDERGLPTDRTLTTRMIEGLVAASGVTGTLIRGGVLNARGPDGKHVTINTVTDHMVDLAEVLSPAELAKVSPSVKAFYANPTMFMGDSRIEALAIDRPNDTLIDDFSRFMTTSIMSVVTAVGAAVIGTEQTQSGAYALEDELLRDREGATHWNRYVVGADGRRKALFLANFKTEDGLMKETFTSTLGGSVPLYFGVTAEDGGIRLTLDRERSSILVTPFADITFTTKPGPDGKVLVRGELSHRNLADAQSIFTATMTPKDQAVNDDKISSASKIRMLSGKTSGLALRSASATASRTSATDGSAMG